MGARGVHFALTQEQVQQLAGCEDQDALEAALEDLEEGWTDDAWLCDADKAWDAAHRCLSDGSLDVPEQPSLLARAVLGGRELSEDADRLVRLVPASEVPQVAAALSTLDEAWLRRRFPTLEGHGYEGPGDEDDLGYTWEYLEELRGLYARAAEAGRAVLFDVSL